MKRWKKIMICIGSLVALGISGTVIYIHQAVSTMAEHMYEPLQLEPFVPPILDAAQISKAPDGGLEPFTVLLLGVDERQQDRGRSDSMLLLAVNPAKQSALLFNIPRDTRTVIAGLGTEDKINHAYAFGGTSMSVRTVEAFLNYPIDYYVKVNMEGLVQIIDRLGGIELYNERAFQYESYRFEQGFISLDGKRALAYSRMRFADPKGDLGRNDRQREVLKAVFQQSLNWKGLANFQSIMDDVGFYVKTNMKLDMLKEVFLDYRPAIKTIDSLEISGTGQKLNGIYYYIVDPQTKLSLQNRLRAYMEAEGSLD